MEDSADCAEAISGRQMLAHKRNDIILAAIWHFSVKLVQQYQSIHPYQYIMM